MRDFQLINAVSLSLSGQPQLFAHHKFQLINADSAKSPPYELAG